MTTQQHIRRAGIYSACNAIRRQRRIGTAHSYLIEQRYITMLRTWWGEYRDLTDKA